MIKHYIFFLLLLFLSSCASDRQLSDDICFLDKQLDYDIDLRINKDGSAFFVETYHSDGLYPGNQHQATGTWKFAEENQIVLVFEWPILIFSDLQNSKDFQKIDSFTFRLNTLADSLHLVDNIWLYRTTCDLKGVRMRRGSIDSTGVFRRDK